MSGFDLVPVNGGDRIHLPPGETVLGRGPFLGVSDKRVSRQHALLENVEGRLHLKPTHLNPCFAQSSPTDDPHPLQKDSWYPLRHGDLFSLLPGQFIYRVVSIGVEECTPRNSQMFEEEKAPALVGGQEHGLSPPQEEPTEEEKDHSNFEAPPHTMEDDSDMALPIYKKRVLPTWMMAAVNLKSPSSSLKAQSAVKRSIKPAASTSNKQTSELSEEEERPKKKSRKDVLLEERTAWNKRGTNRSEVSDKPEEEGIGNFATQTSDARESDEEDRKLKRGPKPAEFVRSDSFSPSTLTKSKPPLRTSCPYGKQCYRKNPIHFQESSHPGDADYKEEECEDTDKADRPECPYGTDCYRKNPLHRREYKHTNKPARSTHGVPPKPPIDDEDDDEDDRFFNADGGDMDNDSDYTPPDSDDSGKEEIRRLQREAKVFLKRNK